MKALLDKDPDLTYEELKLKILEARNLPADPNDPFWLERGKTPSTLGKFRNRGENFKVLFDHAWNQL